MANRAVRKQTSTPATTEQATRKVLAHPVADQLIHERVRLSIVSFLAVNDTLSFNELKKMLNITDGNLSIHARKLEDAGYVSCEKSFEGRMPKTTFRLTDKGREALERYLNHMEQLIKATRA